MVVLHTIIVTSSDGTTAKTTLMKKLEIACTGTAEYCIDRIHQLCEEERYDDAYALNQELREWINEFGNPQEIMYLQYLGE